MRRSFDSDRALTASTRVTYEVFKGSVSTGRAFTSLPAAQRYAETVGGTIRTKA